MKLALRARARGGGARRGPALPDGTVTSPTLLQQLHDILAAHPDAKWASWEPVGRENVDGGRAAGVRRAGRGAVPLRRGRRRRLARVGLPRQPDPAMPRKVRDFASRRRGKGSQPALRRRVDARRSRARRRTTAVRWDPREIEAFARAVADGIGVLKGASGAAAAPRTPSPPPSSRTSRRTSGASLVIAGESQPPARARARARDERGARQRRQDRRVHRARRRRPADEPVLHAPGARRRHGGRQGLLPRHRRRQPGLRRARGPRVREGHGEGGAARPPGALRGRDLAAVPLARRAGARARELERRAVDARHRHDPAAADRAALRREDGARAAGGVLRAARQERARHRQGLLEEPPGLDGARRRLRHRVAHRPARRRRQGQRVQGEGRPRGFLGARIQNPKSQTQNRRERASRSSSAPTRRSGTAATPTTAGCRSCRSR